MPDSGCRPLVSRIALRRPGCSVSPARARCHCHPRYGRCDHPLLLRSNQHGPRQEGTARLLQRPGNLVVRHSCARRAGHGRQRTARRSPRHRRRASGGLRKRRWSSAPAARHRRRSAPVVRRPSRGTETPGTVLSERTPCRLVPPRAQREVPALSLRQHPRVSLASPSRMSATCTKTLSRQAVITHWSLQTSTCPEQQDAPSHVTGGARTCNR